MGTLQSRQDYFSCVLGQLYTLRHDHDIPAHSAYLDVLRYYSSVLLYTYLADYGPFLESTIEKRAWHKTGTCNHQNGIYVCIHSKAVVRPSP